METCIDNVEDVSVIDVASVAVEHEVIVTPVPYVGNEQPIVIGRPPVNEFMITKPA